MSDASRIWSLERLAAALGLAALGFVAATRLMMTWPDPVIFGYFQYASAALGFVVGWRVVGLLLGRGIGHGLSAGITGAVVLLVLCFACFSIYEAIWRNASMTRIAPDVVMFRYWNMVSTWAGHMTDWVFWAILFGGGALVGLLSELISPRRD